ncbi:hypothetical protein EYC80_009138 [Monilinia laxa]|uniref:2EXR domain-containing protein n=1 Tax=Monilinia laxa TaxID=61186 RepID=A0A5N6K2K0_MONLA|nr:hypothetical protein EYC80_009138 [Monilinia laxa]
MSKISQTPRTFTQFPDLPAELQQKIWKFKVEEEIANLTSGRVIKLTQRKLKMTVSQWQKNQSRTPTHTQTTPGSTFPFPKNFNPGTMSLRTGEEMLALGQTWRPKGMQKALKQHFVGMYSAQSLPPPIAALISVCYSARRAVEKSYTFACGLTKPMVFFNFNLDTLYISHKDIHLGTQRMNFIQKLHCTLRAGRPEDWARVKFLGIELPADEFRGVGRDKVNRRPLPFQPYMAEILRYFPGLVEFSVVLGDYTDGDERDGLMLFEPINIPKTKLALAKGLLEDFEDFETYDYDSCIVNVRPRYYHDLDPLVGGLQSYAEYAETIGDPPLTVPDLDCLFTKIIIGPRCERELEEARQKYLSRRLGQAVDN